MWSFGRSGIGPPFRSAPRRAPPSTPRSRRSRRRSRRRRRPIVSPSATATQRQKYGIAALGVLRAVDRVDDHACSGPSPWRPISSETMRTSSRSKCCSAAVSAASSSAAVTSPPSPWPTGRSRSSRARHRREHGLHVGDGRAAELGPVGHVRPARSQREEEQARRSAWGRSTSTSAASSRRARRTRPPARSWARARGTRRRPRPRRPRRSPRRRTACSSTPCGSYRSTARASSSSSRVEPEEARRRGRARATTVSQLDVMKPLGLGRRSPARRGASGRSRGPGARDETSTANVCVAVGSSSRNATAVS